MSAKLMLLFAKYLPEREIAMLIISLLEEIAEKTTNKVDDVIIGIVKEALSTKKSLSGVA